MIYIIDEMMGSGKTSAIINMINSSNDERRFIFVTPYLTEVGRIIDSCKEKKFKQPSYKKKMAKLLGLKILLEGGHNIATTHSLFHKFDDDVLEYIKKYNYTLILDEVTDVIKVYLKSRSNTSKDTITKSDLINLKNNYWDVDEKTGFCRWKDNTYDGKYNKYKYECQNDSIALYGPQCPLWIFPKKTFEAFETSYVLTYMFDCQIQKYYFDMFGINFEYMGVNIENGKYILGDVNKKTPTTDFRNLIHIIENEKLNSIGNDNNALTKSWYKKNEDNPKLLQLKKNTVNYYKNICHSKSKQNLWTTFKDYKQIVKGDGYANGFISCNMRATNEYADRKYVAYLMNCYMNPNIKNFLFKQGITVNENGYALSEMLQFIWRSAIRKGEEIWIYIPSKRMRTLLKDWIEENSPPIE